MLGNFNLPIDFHIFQDGYCTTNQPIDPIYPIWILDDFGPI